MILESQQKHFRDHIINKTNIVQQRTRLMAKISLTIIVIKTWAIGSAELNHIS